MYLCLVFAVFLFYYIVLAIHCTGENSSISDMFYKKWWFSAFNYNKECDLMVREFLKGVTGAYIEDGGFYLVLKNKDKRLYLWIENKFYGYCTSVSLCHKNEDRLFGKSFGILSRPGYRAMREIYDIEMKVKKGEHKYVKHGSGSLT